MTKIFRPLPGSSSWAVEAVWEELAPFQGRREVWRRRRRERRAGERLVPELQNRTRTDQDRGDSFLSWVPESPPVSFLQIGFIECNILIKNTHTFPFWYIKRFLTKHCNVAINFSPSTLTSNNSAWAFCI